MKKLIFAFALLFGTMFASCNGHSETTTEPVDSVEVVVDSIDSVDIVDTIPVNDAGSPVAPDSI